MSNYQVDADVVHDIPDEIATVIGHIMVSHAKLEYKLTLITGLLLQLNKTEARIVLREPRAEDRLEMALDIFAIKDIKVMMDGDALRKIVAEATQKRDWLAHGIWLRHPKTGELFLRIARGTWPKAETKGRVVKRSVFPQSIPYTATHCRETLALIERAFGEVEKLGRELDEAIQREPEKFRLAAPLVNPLGIRPAKPKAPQPPKRTKLKQK